MITLKAKAGESIIVLVVVDRFGGFHGEGMQLLVVLDVKRLLEARGQLRSGRGGFMMRTNRPTANERGHHEMHEREKFWRVVLRDDSFVQNHESS